MKKTDKINRMHDLISCYFHHYTQIKLNRKSMFALEICTGFVWFVVQKAGVSI